MSPIEHYFARGSNTSITHTNYRCNTVGLQGSNTQGAAGEDRAMHPKLRLGPLQHQPASNLVLPRPLAHMM